MISRKVPKKHGSPNWDSCLPRSSQPSETFAHWMRPEAYGTNLLNLPSGSQVMKEPFGVVLIIGPWNYPFQLLINPLVGAIAAGNCRSVKSK